MINQGDKVYDKDGKLVGEFVLPLYKGEIPTSRHFKNSDGSSPSTGEIIPREVDQFIRTKMGYD